MHGMGSKFHIKKITEIVIKRTHSRTIVTCVRRRKKGRFIHKWSSSSELFRLTKERDRERGGDEEHLFVTFLFELSAYLKFFKIKKIFYNRTYFSYCYILWVWSCVQFFQNTRKKNSIKPNQWTYSTGANVILRA